MPKSGVATTRTQSPTAPTTPISVASSPRDVSQSGQNTISALTVVATAEVNRAKRIVGAESMDSFERRRRGSVRSRPEARNRLTTGAEALLASGRDAIQAAARMSVFVLGCD